MSTGPLTGMAGVVSGSGAPIPTLKKILLDRGANVIDPASLPPGPAEPQRADGAAEPQPAPGPAEPQRADGTAGRLGFWIHVAGPMGGPLPFVALDPSGFEARCENVMVAGLEAVQAAMGAGVDSILFVMPTVAMAGAAGQVAYCTALEGLRILVKSTARQWGSRGLRANCLAVGGEQFELASPIAPASGPGPNGPRPSHPPGLVRSLSAPALGGPGSVLDLAPMVEFLCGPGSSFVTGLTLCLDGGTWMAP
ncbi:MAG: SDR family oxidoreductase [Acidimicrobiales bacterium]